MRYDNLRFCNCNMDQHSLMSTIYLAIEPNHNQTETDYFGETKLNLKIHAVAAVSINISRLSLTGQQ